MKKLLTVSLLGALLSIPSVVFAQAEWYGSIRTGVASNDSNQTGVADFGSRWGIRGSSEVSEGLTALYNYESSFNSTDANVGAGRISQVGLSGGFGTITLGNTWTAAYNHFGGIVDQAQWYGSSGATGPRNSDMLSYSVSVGNVSLGADAVMDQSEGKTGDGFSIGATLGGLLETGSIAIAHRKHQDYTGADDDEDAFSDTVDANVERASSFVAGNYGIGDMTVFLGYSEDKAESDTTTEDDASEVANKIIFAGVHGGVGDTGVNYIFTMRSAKAKTTTVTSSGTSAETVKTTPWTLGLNRSLGGGATLRFEHGEPDTSADSSTAVWLQVNF